MAGQRSFEVVVFPVNSNPIRLFWGTYRECEEFLENSKSILISTGRFGIRQVEDQTPKDIEAGKKFCDLTGIIPDEDLADLGRKIRIFSILQDDFGRSEMQGKKLAEFIHWVKHQDRMLAGAPGEAYWGDFLNDIELEFGIDANLVSEKPPTEEELKMLEEDANDENCPYLKEARANLIAWTTEVPLSLVEFWEDVYRGSWKLKQIIDFGILPEEKIMEMYDLQAIAELGEKLRKQEEK